jgi:hypothetical protein
MKLVESSDRKSGSTTVSISWLLIGPHILACQGTLNPSLFTQMNRGNKAS